MENDSISLVLEEQKSEAKDMEITGVAVTTNPSNGQYFPANILRDVAKDMVGIPIIASGSEVEAHADAPSNYIGKVTDAWYEEKDGVGYAKFKANVWNEEAKRIIHEFKDRLKFSVRFSHVYEKDEEGKRKTTKFGQWRHIALLTIPADPDAKIEEAKAQMWSEVNYNELPDSAFLWIDPRYKSGESSDKSLRKFPYKFPDGAISKEALIAICGYLNGARGVELNIPDNEIPAIRNKLNRLRSEVGLPPCEEKKSEVKKMEEEQNNNEKFVEEIKALQEEIKSKDKMIEEMKSQIEVLQKENTEMKTEMKQKDVEQYVDGLVDSGVIPPAIRDETVEHYVKMPDELFEEEKKLNEKKKGILSEMTEEKSIGGEDKKEIDYSVPPEDMKVV